MVLVAASETERKMESHRINCIAKQRFIVLVFILCINTNIAQERIYFALFMVKICDSSDPHFYVLVGSKSEFPFSQ